MPLKKTFTATAPGKLFWCGEHAVVYDSPALLSAVAPGVMCEARWDGPKAATKDALPDLDLKELLPASGKGCAAFKVRKKQLVASELIALKAKLDQDYAAFLAAEQLAEDDDSEFDAGGNSGGSASGHSSNTDSGCSKRTSSVNKNSSRILVKDSKDASGIVTQLPKFSSFELAAYHVALMLTKHPELSKGSRLTIIWQWQMHPGCGMGASAALLWSLTRCLVGDHPWQWEDYYLDALTSENLQHGHSSGLDLLSEVFGGFCIFRPKAPASTDLSASNKCKWQPELISFIPPFRTELVFSGAPLSHTGECVTATRALFKKSPQLLKDGKAIILEAILAIKQQNYAAFLEALKANEAWLEAIRVVPDKVKAFVKAAAKLGGIVKLTGAGAVRGDAGGMLLLLSPLGSYINWAPLLKEFNYTLEPVQLDIRGVQLVAR